SHEESPSAFSRGATVLSSKGILDGSSIHISSQPFDLTGSQIQQRICEPIDFPLPHKLIASTDGLVLMSSEFEGGDEIGIYQKSLYGNYDACLVDIGLFSRILSLHWGEEHTALVACEHGITLFVPSL